MPVLSPFAGKQDTADAVQRAAGRGRAGSLPCSSRFHGSAVPRDPAGGGSARLDSNLGFLLIISSLCSPSKEA